MKALVDDIRYAWRRLLATPLQSVLALITLAFGAGAASAIFSVVDGVLLRPLPFVEPDRLVAINATVLGMGTEGWYGSSEPEVIDLEALDEAFESVGAYSWQTVVLGDSLQPRRVDAVLATAGFFPALGVKPVLGRVFTAEENRRGVDRVAVISWQFWQSQFGGSADVLSREIQLPTTTLRIVGVMPRGVAFPDPGVPFWIPLQIDRANPFARNNHYLEVVARVRPGLSPEAARARAEALAARSARAYPAFYPNEGYRVRLRPLREQVVGDVERALLVLLGAVGLLLAIACVNVANLLIARGEGRRREMAVRSALGAKRGRLARLVLTESLVLAFLGGLAGIGLASVGTSQLLRLAPSSIPRLNEVHVNGTVLVFALAIVIVTGIGFGLLPALSAARLDATRALKEGGTGRVGGRSRQLTRRSLVVIQLALAVALLIAAGVLMRSFSNLYRVDSGIDPDDVLTLRAIPSTARYKAGEAMVGYHERLMSRVRTLPGVNAVAEVSNLPLSDGLNGWSFQIEGREAATVAEAPASSINQVTPDYFRVMGQRVVQGRVFTEADRADAPPVVVISESLAKKYFPGEDPVGRRMRVYTPNWPWMEIVGVVGDVRHYGLEHEGGAVWYVPHAQAYRSAYTSFPAMTLVMRTSVEPSSLAEDARATVREVDPTVPIEAVKTMRGVMATSLGPRRFTTLLIGVFAAVALFLASVGVYGVVACGVMARRREIGVRMALGAEAGRVLASVLGEAVVLASVGVAGGVGLGYLFSSALRGLVFDVSPMDPATCAGVGAVLLVMAVAAALGPGLRATHVDPLVVLRSE